MDYEDANTDAIDRSIEVVLGEINILESLPLGKCKKELQKLIDLREKELQKLIDLREAYIKSKKGRIDMFRMQRS